MKKILFTKVEAVGNTFIIVNSLEISEMDWAALATAMCAHHTGIGSDGLLVIGDSDEADFSLRMFNPDGTEDSSGNGLRCAAVYALNCGLTAKKAMTFDARDGIRSVEILDSGENSVVRANMGRPLLEPKDIPMNFREKLIDYPLNVGGETHNITVISVGTPHAVIAKPLEYFWDAMPKVSKIIETHPMFPERVNVTWSFIESPESLRIRTWERGVGPTLSCGSGACAALAAANLTGLAGESAKVTAPGGVLDIEWPDRGDIFISGPARVIFQGEWPIDNWIERALCTTNLPNHMTL